MNINVEGVILSNKSLTNFELDDAAKALNIPNFRGVFCRNELPKVLLRDTKVVMNEVSVVY